LYSGLDAWFNYVQRRTFAKTREVLWFGGARTPLSRDIPIKNTEEFIQLQMSPIMSSDKWFVFVHFIGISKISHQIVFTSTIIGHFLSDGFFGAPFAVISPNQAIVLPSTGKRARYRILKLSTICCKWKDISRTLSGTMPRNRTKRLARWMFETRKWSSSRPALTR
jgi:hypothetical protein